METDEHSCSYDVEHTSVSVCLLIGHNISSKVKSLLECRLCYRNLYFAHFKQWLLKNCASITIFKFSENIHHHVLLSTFSTLSPNFHIAMQTFCYMKFVLNFVSFYESKCKHYCVLSPDTMKACTQYLRLMPVPVPVLS